MRTMKTCDCGATPMYCLAIKANGTKCKNYPKLCGLCGIHCAMKQRRKKQ